VYSSGETDQTWQAERVPEPACDLCEDTGEMSWQQPVPGPDGAVVLRQMSHPCVAGCSGWRKLPAAEHTSVIDVGGDAPVVGNVALAAQDHRSDWFLPQFGADSLDRTYRSSD
jgi:hypothetical protein